MVRPVAERKPTETACDLVDRLPPDLRELVHDYGLHIVNQFVACGVRRPDHIRQLVRSARVGAREPGNERDPGMKRPGKRALAHIDTWMLGQGATFNARMLVRAIRDGGFTVISTSPSAAMLEASMAEVSGFNMKCSRSEKHQRRLQAALVTGDREAWGDL